MAVPDSIPEAVDEVALKKADQLGCDGIRLLLVSANGADCYYYVTFLSDKEKIKEDLFIAQSGDIMDITEADRQKITSLETNLLIEAGITCDPCWSLATVWKDAYYSGSSFQFSQQTYSTGYFHKVINDLGAWASGCTVPFNGGFDNCISSHQWGNQTACGYRTVVDRMKVWTRQNRSGDSYTFTGTKAYHDNNWIDETYLDPLGFPHTINDEISSIDMMYYVYYQ